MKKPNVAPIYVFIWERASEVARESGYCLALHGTLSRDLDLLACPWTDDAVPAEELVSRLAKDLAWRITEDGQQVPHVTGPEPKPHGRLAWSIPYMAHWQIDLSVMPRQEPAALSPADPIPMVLHCPRCGMQHVDLPQPEKVLGDDHG